jgi:pimeloyl-[acyl-carrier protein] methyl ester esterase
MPVHILPDGAAMSCTEAGAGDPFVLVHGWAANGDFFRDLSAELAKGRRVFALTLRGHPGSTKGAAPLSIETLADDIVHFFNQRDLRNAIALGWSMGAMVIWAAADRLAARLSGIVVEDMAPRLVNDATWRDGIGGGYGAGDVATTLSEINDDWPACVARFAPRMFASKLGEGRPELIAWAIREMSRADAAGMAALWASMAQQDFRGAVARIATPMLTIDGGESQVYPDGAAAFVAQTAPNARRIVIQGAGHVPHLEAPHEFLNHVEAFVRDTRRSELRSGGAVT